MKLSLILTLAITGAIAAPAHETSSGGEQVGIMRFTQGMRASSKGGFKCFLYWFDNAIDNPLRKIGGPLVCKILPNPLNWGECPENRDKYIDLYGNSCGETNLKSYEIAEQARRQGGQQQQQQPRPRPQPQQQQQRPQPQWQQQRPQPQWQQQQQQQQQQQPDEDWQNGS
ncbi:hypothetical protein CP533_5314 [Ophiocordyceps camponoti-saundersi (nom. inval.)]|nr:hypothetical protein CP533_5314 [Ophiocordyceps camponoti-saundersi (nom. inval.)]